MIVVLPPSFDFLPGIVDSNGVAFSVTPSVSEQMQEGRTLSDGTLHWWLRQSAAAQEAQVRTRVSVARAREILHTYFSEAAEEYGDYLVWGSALGFDCEILGHFLGGKPWSCYSERCVRGHRSPNPA